MHLKFKDFLTEVNLRNFHYTFMTKLENLEYKSISNSIIYTV
jgi:hypothetical protein